MTDERASRWSWATTLLCAAYVAWTCYVIGTRVPEFTSLLAGLGGELPRATTFVMALSKGPIYVIGLVLIVGLILKEKLVTKIVARFAVTVIVFMMGISAPRRSCSPGGAETVAVGGERTLDPCVPHPDLSDAMEPGP